MKAQENWRRKNATFESRDAERPHCWTECEVREGNGVYECPECEYVVLSSGFCGFALLVG